MLSINTFYIYYYKKVIKQRILHTTTLIHPFDCESTGQTPSVIFMFMDGGPLGTFLWFLIFMVFIFLYPKLMLSQLIMKLEQSALKMEALSVKARMLIRKKTGNKSKEIDAKIKDFQDFIAIEPSSLDPFGIVRKIDQLTRNVESRFTEFVKEIAGKKSKTDMQRINYGLRAAIGVNTIAKIVRHYVEMAKKYKNLQIALILQMQLPMIEKIAQSEFKGTEAFINGWPVGDSIGPMVAASMMSKGKEIAEDVVCDETTAYGRKLFILKASGPEPHLGRIDEAIEKIIKRNRVAKVITIDAAGKLEGEKTGSVAEGVGFAMGGGAEREIIENILLPKKIPLDSIVVKVGQEEAIIPMKMEIKNALPKVVEAIKNSIKRTKRKGAIIVVGVGNSCGIGNDKKSLKEVEKTIKMLEKRRKKEEMKKKRKWF